MGRPSAEQAPSLLENVVRAQSRYFKWAALISILTSLLAITPTIYMMVVYNRVVTSRNETTLVMFLICAIGLYALMETLELVRTRLLLVAGWRIDHALRDRIHDQSYASSRLQKSIGTQAFTDIRQIREFMGSPVLGALLDSPSSLLFLAAISVMNPWLAVTSLFIASVQIFIGIRTEKKTLPALDAATRAHLQAQANLSGVLRNAQVVSAMGMKDALYKRWAILQRAFLFRQAQASDMAGTNNATSKFIQTLQGSLLLGLSCWLTLKGVLMGGGGMMIVASMLGGRVLAPLVTVIGSWRQVVYVRQAWDRLGDFLKDDEQQRITVSLPKPEGVLAVEGLYVQAPNSETLLIKNASFAALPGETLLIAGPSAAGKTTLARTLVGAWPASAGKVRLDGADLHASNKTELGPHIGYLPQNVELFDGTLAENIARFEASDSELIKEKLQTAIDLCGLTDFVNNLSNGMHTRIGDAGTFLSGGQRQRVGIARAVYGDPKFVVLDEPNSNLDEAGEQALNNTLQALKERQCTTIVISHRTSILPAIDHILILRDGVVRLHGTRDEVLSRLDAPRSITPEQIQNKNEAEQEARPKVQSQAKPQAHLHTAKGGNHDANSVLAGAA